jgi:predicted RNase H-like nuclease (RuvC/YqgF family)
VTEQGVRELEAEVKRLRDEAGMEAGDWQDAQDQIERLTAELKALRAQHERDLWRDGEQVRVLRTANVRLGKQIEQLLVVRDKQRIEIEFLHDRLRQIVLLAQLEARR